MKFLRITKFCVPYAEYFYTRHPEVAGKPFAEQQAAFTHDHFGWGKAYTQALRGVGYDAMEFVADIAPLQHAWGLEHGLRAPEKMSAARLVLEQVKWFRPDILQFELNDGALLDEIRRQVPGIKLVLGWEGSALSTGSAWRAMDVVLSCATEGVTALRAAGVRSEHMNHAFDPEVNARLAATRRLIPMSFIGSIIRRNQFHVERDRVLAALVPGSPIEIYSPSINLGAREYAKIGAASAAFIGLKVLKTIGVGVSPRVTRIASRPRLPINPALRKHLRPAAFGLDYFQIMRDSAITLNIHADSSPTHASNIRLFEGTGVGSCLLTDKKNNLAGLFDLNTEIVPYDGAEDCAEKAQWLLDNPKRRMEIAARGQRRTLRHHTFPYRAKQIDAIIRAAL